MNIRKLPTIAAVAVLSGAVLAQQAAIIGSVTAVQGLVTVSDATSVTTVVTGAVVVDGARFVTSSTGSLTLMVNKDCEVKLQPNQSVMVTQDQPCREMIAAIQTLPGSSGIAVASNETAAKIFAGAALAALLLSGGHNKPPATSTGGGTGDTPFLSPQ